MASSRDLNEEGRPRRKLCILLKASIAVPGEGGIRNKMRPSDLMLFFVNKIIALLNLYQYLKPIKIC